MRLLKYSVTDTDIIALFKTHHARTNNESIKYLV
jgi:hypothetical protein